MKCKKNKMIHTINKLKQYKIMTNEITLKEAIDQGYKYFGIENWEWQSCQNLKEGLFEEVGEYNHENIRLFCKEPKVTSISEDEIADIIAYHVSVVDSEECYRDNNIIYQVIVRLNFSEMVKTINKKLEEYKYYNLTNIKVVK